MNRIKNIIEGREVEALLQATIDNIFVNGPVSISDMETLSYIKYYHAKLFERYKQSILLASGLFYKPLNTEAKNLKELILQDYREVISTNLAGNYTPMQADLLKSVDKNNVFSFSAPTSTGKSYVFRRLIESSEHDVVIVVPSRALINEYYLNLTKSIVDTSINILTYIDIINRAHSTRNVFIVTPERCGMIFNHVNDLRIDLMLFDEAQLSDEMSVRGLYYDGLVRRCYHSFPEAKFVFAHPFIANPDAQIVKNHLTGQYSDSKAYSFRNIGQMFLLYNSDKNKYYHFGIDKSIMGGTRTDCYFDPIERAIHTNGTVLVYMSKSKVVNYDFLREYDRYVRMCPEINAEIVDDIIEELKQYTGGNTSETGDYYSRFISLLRRGIVIHHGSMPLRTRSLVEKFVNNKLCRLCFSTSTLEQGINMPFDVVLLDRFESSKPLAIKNLIGRAGRSSNKDDFDIGYVVVTSNVNMTKLRNILLEESKIKDYSSLDRQDALDEDFHDYKEAINNHTMDDRFNLPPVVLQRVVEGDGSQEVRNVLDIMFDKGGNLIPKEKYKDIASSAATGMQKIYERSLGRILGDGEKNVFNTAIQLMLIRLLFHATFKQLCRWRYYNASRLKERKQREKKGLKSDHLTSAFVTGFSDLPKKDLPVFSIFKGTKAKDVSYDAILYDTYDFLDKLIDFKLGELFYAAFMSYFEKNQDERAERFSKLLRYGTDDSRYIWMIRYGLEFEDIEKLNAHIRSIDANGIDFYDSIHDVPEKDKEVIKRYIN
ncbi:Helicase conserved C-terminal domain-containing protein [Segatella bryantii]|uniref:DEAD/DEAH box helicase n=1 Tax=Segatella bryantii TaxID=77095 RepID=UPI0008979A10|nr:DEAD/DEAH box helicase [Segatella bryantii]SEA47059.1 Helicase conserved C-terminal domain-containing protein [Segatella bryantii]